MQAEGVKNMWDLMAQSPWGFNVLTATLVGTLLLGLLFFLIQSVRFRSQIGALEKELNVIAQFAMGMGDKLVDLEKAYANNKPYSLKQGFSTPGLEQDYGLKKDNALGAEYVQQSRYQQVDCMLAAGEATESVMLRYDVSKAEIDLMNLLKEGKGSSFYATVD